MYIYIYIHIYLIYVTHYVILLWPSPSVLWRLRGTAEGAGFCLFSNEDN